MTDADDAAPGRAQGAPVPPEVQADVREALQQVADLFGGGAGGDHGVFERLNALGHLNDPAVRERLTAAMQALRTANLQGAQGGPVVMDLRGTEAGQALREMLQGLTGGALVQTISSPAQVFVNGQQVDPATFPAPSAATPPQIVEAAAHAAGPILPAPVTPAPQPTSAQSIGQPSIVEDASRGGVFGWLSRLLNGR